MHISHKVIWIAKIQSDLTTIDDWKSQRRTTVQPLLQRYVRVHIVVGIMVVNPKSPSPIPQIITDVYRPVPLRQWRVTSECALRLSTVARCRSPRMLSLLQVNFFTGSYHDAVLLFGMALNESLTDGDNLTDGYAFSKRMWDRDFVGMVSTESL